MKLVRVFKGHEWLRTPAAQVAIAVVTLVSLVVASGASYMWF